MLPKSTTPGFVRVLYTLKAPNAFLNRPQHSSSLFLAVQLWVIVHSSSISSHLIKRMWKMMWPNSAEIPLIGYSHYHKKMEITWVPRMWVECMVSVSATTKQVTENVSLLCSLFAFRMNGPRPLRQWPESSQESDTEMDWIQMAEHSAETEIPFVFIFTFFILCTWPNTDTNLWKGEEMRIIIQRFKNGQFD